MLGKTKPNMIPRRRAKNRRTEKPRDDRRPTKGPACKKSPIPVLFNSRSLVVQFQNMAECHMLNTPDQMRLFLGSYRCIVDPFFGRTFVKGPFLFSFFLFP